MPPALGYWVIVHGSTPTAFRARDREVLVPTLKQLQRTQPETTLLWFSRGRTWPSEEAAQMALRMRRESPERKGRDWRPGGDHKDPKARYEMTRDEKRAKFKRLQRQKPKTRP